MDDLERDMTKLIGRVTLLETTQHEINQILNEVRELNIKFIRMEEGLGRRDLRIEELNTRLNEIENTLKWVIRGIIAAIISGSVNGYFELLKQSGGG